MTILMGRMLFTVSFTRNIKTKKFLEVITQTEHYIGQFTGDQIVPKFEMLKANAIGRLQGFEAFKEALNYVALTYPNNPEGKKAEQMVADQLPKLAAKEFSLDSIAKGTKNWKVVFEFKRNKIEEATKLHKKLRRGSKRFALQQQGFYRYL